MNSYVEVLIPLDGLTGNPSDARHRIEDAVEVELAKVGASIDGGGTGADFADFTVRGPDTRAAYDVLCRALVGVAPTGTRITLLPASGRNLRNWM